MRRVQAIMACVATAFLLAACGGSEEPSNGGSAEGSGRGASEGNGNPNGQRTMSEAAIEEQYARGQYNLTEDGAADDQYEDAAPEDLPFPLPPEADIIAAGQSRDQAYAVVMNVPSGQEAYEFYLQSLPDEGYEILSDNRAEQTQSNEGESGEGQNGEGQNGEPFSAVLVVEGNDIRGTMRFDEERAIIGMSAAAVEDVAEARARAEERREAREQEAEAAPEEAAPEEAAPEEAAPEEAAPEEAAPGEEEPGQQ